jgi:hypothetical protein
MLLEVSNHITFGMSIDTSRMTLETLTSTIPACWKMLTVNVDIDINNNNPPALLEDSTHPDNGACPKQ